jgi:long-chain-alcohol oxidase
VCRFADLPLERRTDLPPERCEGAMRRWSRQTLLLPLRVFFLITEVFCLYVFYSWVSLPVQP